MVLTYACTGRLTKPDSGYAFVEFLVLFCSDVKLKLSEHTCCVVKKGEGEGRGGGGDGTRGLNFPSPLSVALPVPSSSALPVQVILPQNPNPSSEPKRNIFDTPLHIFPVNCNILQIAD